MANCKILIVDDDDNICQLLNLYLIKEGYRTHICNNGKAAVKQLAEEDFNVVLLDIMMPGIDGFELCVRMRQMMDIPVIFLSAKDEEADQVVGFTLGADDYVTKPFKPRELVARARALLRRVHADSEPQREVLEFGELTIDVSGHKVLVSGEEIDLTASEFKLLTTLSRYPGRVYSRMELVEKVLGYDFEGYERTIDSHVKNLRAKIGDNPRSPKWLHTVHGVGYRFEDPTKQ